MSDYLFDYLLLLNNKKTLNIQGFSEQMTGVEPASSAWEADVLPIYYICLITKHLPQQRLL